MQRLLTATVCCILQVAFASMMFAQAPTAATTPVTKTPAQQNFRWMEYSRATFIPSDFQSIIPVRDEGPLAANSEYYSPTVRIPARFKVPVHILGNKVFPESQENQHIEASVAGFFKFTRDNEPIVPFQSTSYFLARHTGSLSRLIMPYWGALQSRDVPGGGIYYRYLDINPQIDGPDKLIIEWRVQPAKMPSPPILGFQAHIILKEPCSPNMNYYAAIEFHYDTLRQPFSWLELPRNAVHEALIGAAVGLKNLGQVDEHDAYGPPFSNITEEGDGIDNQNTLMLPPPPVPGNSKIVGFTRVPVYLGQFHIPELYAYLPRLYEGFLAPYSSFFHMSFPTQGYKIKPVDNDLLTIIYTGGIDSTQYPDSSNIVISPGRSISVSSRFLHRGCAAPRNVTLKAVIYRNNRVFDSVQYTGITFQPGADTLVTFPKIVIGPKYKPGTYTLAVFHNYLDDIPANDTASTIFHVRTRSKYDFGPVEILEPDLKRSSERLIFNYGSPIRIKARFANMGLTTVRSVPFGYRILDHQGKQVHSARLTPKRVYAPGTSTIVTFPDWEPRATGSHFIAPGTYYIEVYSALPGDSVRSNDTLAGTGRVQPSWWGRDPQALRRRRITFELRPKVDIEVLGTETHPHAPATGSVVPESSFTPLLFFRNNGSKDARNIRVQVTITNPLGLASSHTVIIPEIKAGNIIEFPLGRTNIRFSGNYCVDVTVKFPDDVVVSNNRTKWCFKAQR